MRTHAAGEERAPEKIDFLAACEEIDPGLYGHCEAPRSGPDVPSGHQHRPCSRSAPLRTISAVLTAAALEEHLKWATE